MPSSSPPPLPPAEETTASAAALAPEGGFSLTEPSFLESLMPKKEIGVDRFLAAHPEYDGRSALIAIFDSGVDPAAAGLQTTSDGKPKILDVLDCTGSGDVDTSKVVKADADGAIVGASGARLVINPSWKNPSQEWHVGCKLIYELFTDTLTSRLKKERKKKWDEENQESISDALKQLNEFEKKHPKPDDTMLKKAHEDMQSRLDYLRKQAEGYDDKGPVIDIVTWNDGDVWRVAVDTQTLEGNNDGGKLADFVPLTNYRLERKYAIFSKLDACSFVANVYNDGNLVSIVTDCSPHATHVAGIAAAFHPDEPLLNGVAPGAQLISCKIGDTRLGSMETGTGLVRALIAAVEHKCDLINMSYGEPTLLPDYGRFIDLSNEVVDKHRIIFISSAGNNGPALNTVGAPGGTSTSIIGVGAYVSPAMAAGAHCVVQPPAKGMEYTWSSRGPTADGDLGVSISAPGGAVAPVPTWTLQSRMLMNGTSMSSPSACGGVALLVSGMKAEGIPLSPYSVRKAIENTAASISNAPEEKLTTGNGLLQVDRAFEYAQQAKKLPLVSYRISINQVGKSVPKLRGIYLRGGNACCQTSEWTVQLDPKFHEGASNLEQLVPFEECLQLHSTDTSVVQIPEYILVTNNGRSFNIVVNPANISSGLHYFEVYGIDYKAPWRGPIFRVPITVIKPIALLGEPPLLSISNLRFQSGHIERRFINVPFGASWAEVTMRTSAFDTPRRFFLDTVQICPLKRPVKWEAVVTFSSPSSKNFSFPVEGGLTLELSIAQFWSSGIASHEPTCVDFEIVLHGISIDQKIRIPYRPVECNLSSLPTDRDKLPSGKQIIALTLTYKFKLEDNAEIKPHVPLLNNRIYDNKFESQFYRISDSNKRIYSSGDVYPSYVRLSKGEYTLQLYIRHENVQFLEKLKELVLFIERKLDKKDFVPLMFYSQPDGPIVGSGTFKSTVLVPGEPEAFYVGPPSSEKLPKNAPPGAVLVGSITYGTVSTFNKKDEQNHRAPVSYSISYTILPSKVDDKEKGVLVGTKSIPEQLDEEVRDTKIKFLSSVKQLTEEDKSAWSELVVSLKSEYPKYTPLLSKILQCVLQKGTDGDKISHEKEVIAAADEVVGSIDKEELAKYLSLNSDPEDEEAQKFKKKIEETRDQLADALYQKCLALAEIESLKSDESIEVSAKDIFEENYKELIKWVDVKSAKYGTSTVLREKRCGRPGTALKILNDLIQNESEPKKKLYDLKIQLIEEMGWNHVSTYEKQWMQVRFPPCLPPF
ncbi:Tripeptidyl-peptidase 2 [Zea mays]|uniref:tripeptidyl-peptidase II n=1 Tax=Zea mays TaxID=4577 RepID=A0A1D6HFD2_MAIZE|nr:Tripeptidyl-peptidase 2 [Zea mays]